MVKPKEKRSLQREILSLQDERDRLEDQVGRLVDQCFDQRDVLRDLVAKTKFQRKLLAAAAKDSARAMKDLA